MHTTCNSVVFNSIYGYQNNDSDNLQLIKALPAFAMAKEELLLLVLLVLLLLMLVLVLRLKNCQLKILAFLH